MNEVELRATSIKVLTMYDSGMPKDRIAEMMDITRNDVDDIINHRCVFRGDQNV